MRACRPSRPLTARLVSCQPCRSSRFLASISTAHARSRSSPRVQAPTFPQGDRRWLGISKQDCLGDFKRMLRVSEEVADAIATNKAVVALESTIYTHGALGDDLALEDVVRQHGGVPAVIGILDGVPTVGLTPDEVKRMVHDGGAVKVSRRDIAYLAGMGIMGRRLHGGTTIAGTMLLARLAGIRVFGTGGLGGVHRGGELSLDISADLTELGRTRVAVVSSGCKGFLDIPRTIEFLETQGVLVSTFADGRDGGVDFPSFWSRDSGTASPSVVRDEREAAAMILCQERLGIESGLLFANPIPREYAIPKADMDAAIGLAVHEASEKGFTGSSNTPYVLGRIRDLTHGKSVLANKALVRSNVARATKISVELCNLCLGSPAYSSTLSTPLPFESKYEPIIPKTSPTDILVAGSVAIDISCDFNPGSLNPPSQQVTPQFHTSNLASISQSIGGVGYNVALAAHLISRATRVRLCSMVGDDLGGDAVLSALEASGLDTTYIRRLGHEYHSSNRTAQYVAVNDAEKNLLVAMADMGIFTHHSFSAYWKSAVVGASPKWLVVDGNWSEKDIHAWTEAGKESNCLVAFEPVSTAKATRLFSPGAAAQLGVFPRPNIDLATPNHYELTAMFTAAKENGYFDSPAWFSVIDAFGMRGARDRFVQLTSVEMTDAGIPVKTIQLLPYMPTILTKLGQDGVLLTQILHRDDPRLRDAKSEPFILCRSLNDHPHIGGVYMRLFPAAEKVDSKVSVNGVGDTFLGVMIAGLAAGGKVERLVDVAQRAAVLTLKSPQSVSPDISLLEKELQAAIGLM